MHRKPPSKGLSPLEKKPPKSIKYANVQGKLDTGMTIDKLKIVSSREYTRRRDEIHYRITKTQLCELYEEYEADEYESISEAAGVESDSGPRIVTYSESSSPQYSKPYLILDVRESDEFNTCHLLQARSFPFALLRRDLIPPDLFSFKNKEGFLIIIYCDDEYDTSQPHTPYEVHSFWL